MTVRVAGCGFDDGGGAAMGHYAAGRNVAPDGYRPAIAIEEHDVDGEAHPEGVNRAAAREEERPAVRRLTPAGEPAEPGPPRLGHNNAHSKEEPSAGYTHPAPPT